MELSAVRGDHRVERLHFRLTVRRGVVDHSPVKRRGENSGSKDVFERIIRRLRHHLDFAMACGGELQGVPEVAERHVRVIVAVIGNAASAVFQEEPSVVEPEVEVRASAAGDVH